MAGVPFDHLEALATRETAQRARDSLDCQSRLGAALEEAERLLGSKASRLSGDASRAYRAALKTGIAPSGISESTPPEITSFLALAEEISALEMTFSQTLQRELEAARRALASSSGAVLPAYLVFGAGEFRERLTDLDGSAALPPRNARTRERERHLLLYLQRVCGKNDTFGAFGPSAWGTIENSASGVSFTAGTGVFERFTFLERWAAHSLAVALNLDSETRMEFAPRLHPNGNLQGDNFVPADSQPPVRLTSEQLDLVGRCDGKTPAHSLGENASLLEELADQRVLLWECEVPALDPLAFETLVRDIAQWRPGPVRARWEERVQQLAALPAQFAATTENSARTTFMATARNLLDDLGPRQTGGQRSLYAAANPIAEECARDCSFVVSEEITDDLARDAAPWFDLWRDTYAYVASRVAAGLRGLLASAPVQDGAVLLPAFLEHCAANRLSLTGPGMVVFAHLAFQEVKQAFREMISSRAQAPEWELTAEDCAFVRRKFEYEKFDEYTYPSADLQLSAESFAAIDRGDYQWVVSELHPPVALMHHALYWSCPDKPALSRAFASSAGQRPAVHFGFFAADFTAHTTVRYMDSLPELMTFVAPQRANPRWRTVRPAEVEVFVDRFTNDVGLRTCGSKEYLGSFARAWLIPLGFHPFHFGASPHMPRLRCGRVIVQRRSWTVSVEELPPGDYRGISRDLVLAIEELRAQKDWPRYVYMRPTEATLRRSGAEGRDKDTKPVFIDLESYLSLEIFHRWLVKAGELEVTEMLPDPDHLCWQESDGRRTFELRTLIVPRS
ncbi:MAG: hypothetical protein ABI946_00065 [Chthoniobacterales bacterium]